MPGIGVDKPRRKSSAPLEDYQPQRKVPSIALKALLLAIVIVIALVGIACLA